MGKTNLQSYIVQAAMLTCLAVISVSCQNSLPPQIQATATTAVPSGETGVPPSETPYQPTPTAEAPAARVNGDAISLAEFQAELQRYSQAAGVEPDDAGRKRVLDELVDQVLLAQGAAAAGFTLSQADLDARLAALAENAGGVEALSAWLAANAYTPETFRAALARQAAAAWMRDELAAAIPAEGEQVRVRQILVDTPQEAADVLAELQAGTNFANLAAQYDPVMEGDLGWVSRGGLTDPAIEEAIFGLQPGEWSAAVETLAGVHILFVSERQDQRPLSAQARLSLQTQAIKDWLEKHRTTSSIEIFSP